MGTFLLLFYFIFPALSLPDDKVVIDAPVNQIPLPIAYFPVQQTQIVPGQVPEWYIQHWNKKNPGILKPDVTVPVDLSLNKEMLDHMKDKKTDIPPVESNEWDKGRFEHPQPIQIVPGQVPDWYTQHWNKKNQSHHYYPSTHPRPDVARPPMELLPPDKDWSYFHPQRPGMERPEGGFLNSHEPPLGEYEDPDHGHGGQHGNGDKCPKDLIHDRFNGKGYFFSWEDRRSSKLAMTWPQAINFCRARCMEVVSVETKKENEFLGKHMKRSHIAGIWTSGRKCDFKGCEKDQYLSPIDVYGWFWEGTHVQLPPTTDRFDTCWSETGSRGNPQPDNNEGLRGGEHESCLSILNNKYHDGITWHDEICSLRKPFVCEETSPRDKYLEPKQRFLPVDAEPVLFDKLPVNNDLATSRLLFHYQVVA